MRKKLTITVALVFVLISAFVLVSCSVAVSTDTDGKTVVATGVAGTDALKDKTYYYTYESKVASGFKTDAGLNLDNVYKITMQNDGGNRLYFKDEKNTYLAADKQEWTTTEGWWHDMKTVADSETQKVLALKTQAKEADKDSATTFASYETVASLADFFAEYAEYSLESVMKNFDFLKDQDGFTVDTARSFRQGNVEKIYIEFADKTAAENLGVIELSFINISSLLVEGEVKYLTGVTNRLTDNMLADGRNYPDGFEHFNFTVYNSGSAIGYANGTDKENTVAENWANGINNPEETKTDYTLFIIIGVVVALIVALVAFILVRRNIMKKRMLAYKARKQAEISQSDEDNNNNKEIETSESDK